MADLVHGRKCQRISWWCVNRRSISIACERRVRLCKQSLYKLQKLHWGAPYENITVELGEVDYRAVSDDTVAGFKVVVDMIRLQHTVNNKQTEVEAEPDELELETLPLGLLWTMRHTPTTDRVMVIKWWTIWSKNWAGWNAPKWTARSSRIIQENTDTLVSSRMQRIIS